MNQLDFFHIFDNMPIAVIVCNNSNELRVLYMNMQASMLFDPSRSSKQDAGAGRVDFKLDLDMKKFLHFRSETEQSAFFNIVDKVGQLNQYPCTMITFDGQSIPVYITGNSMRLEHHNDCFIFYIRIRAISPIDNTTKSNQLASIINASFLAEGVDASIQTALQLTGSLSGVSRAYIFEEISDDTIQKTYEWDALGTTPAIQQYQNPNSKNHHYETVVEWGMFVVDDVRRLPKERRELLEKQGVKSLLVLPIYDQGKVQGYVGIEDCAEYRRWRYDEIQFLKSVSILLTTFLKRRDAELKARSSQNMLQLVSNNSEDLIYVNSLDDYRVLFVSRSLADTLGKTTEELLGAHCWQVLQANQTGPCTFCPVPKIEYDSTTERSNTYMWEHHNLLSNKTYLAKDNIVRWVDGKQVHIQTAIDISQRKKYEQQLQYFASTDTMTGAFKREWGREQLEKRLQNNAKTASLCFIDVDRLKHTNDEFGHAAGDEMLAETCRIIKEHLASEEIICRWGGDEFLLWLDSSAESSHRRVERIQRDLEKYNQRNHKPFWLSVSYGIVDIIAGQHQTLDGLVTAADKLMYKNKIEKRGKNMRRRRGE